MNIIFTKTDRTYGGYDFVEMNESTQVYYTGNSRSFAGHLTGFNMKVEVSTKKELKAIETRLREAGYIEL